MHQTCQTKTVTGGAARPWAPGRKGQPLGFRNNVQQTEKIAERQSVVKPQEHNALSKVLTGPHVSMSALQGLTQSAVGSLHGLVMSLDSVLLGLAHNHQAQCQHGRWILAHGMEVTALSPDVALE